MRIICRFCNKTPTTSRTGVCVNCRTHAPVLCSMCKKRKTSHITSICSSCRKVTGIFKPSPNRKECSICHERITSSPIGICSYCVNTYSNRKTCELCGNTYKTVCRYCKRVNKINRIAEALTRNNSFTSAGKELGLTQQRISYLVNTVDELKQFRANQFTNYPKKEL